MTLITNVSVISQPLTPYLRCCATLPAPIPWRAAWSPFEVRCPDGTIVPAQWERHVLAAGGYVESAEFIWPARGTGVYSIQRASESKHDQRCNPGRFAQGYVDGLESALGVTFAEDWVRYGSYLCTQRFDGPHKFGWVTTYEGLDVVLVEMVLHDCEPGSGDWYFPELRAPYDLPYEAPWLEWGYPNLIEPRADGALNLLPRKGTRVFRWVAHDGSSAGLASVLARGGSWTAPDALWRVRGHQVQPCTIPDTRAWSGPLGALTDQRASNLDNGLATKTQCGVGPKPGVDPMGDVGFMPPWSSEYGGITGGGATLGGRNLWIGWEYQGSHGDPDFLRWAMTWQMMVLNRCPVTILEAGGRPVDVSKHLNPDGSPKQGWDVSVAELGFERGPQGQKDWRDGSFKFAQTPAAVDPGDVLPTATWNKLSSYSTANPYKTIDNDHEDRAYSPSVALAGLANDQVSIWHLRAWAVQHTMQFRTGGFLNWVQTCTANPGHGTQWNRNPAHSITLMAAAYRFSGNKIRNLLRPWLRDFCRTLLAAQMVNGMYCGWDTKTCDLPPFGDGSSGSGQWRITKITNECFLVNALWACIGSGALEAADVPMVKASIVRWATRGLWEFQWGAGITGPVPSGSTNVIPRTPYLSEPLLAPTIRAGGEAEETGAAIGAALWCATESEVEGLKPLLFRYCGGATSLQGCRDWFKTRTLGQARLDDSAPVLAWLERYTV